MVNQHKNMVDDRTASKIAEKSVSVASCKSLRIFTKLAILAGFVAHCAMAKGNVPTDSRSGMPIEEYRRLEEKAIYDQSCKDRPIQRYRSSDGTKHADCYQ